MNSKEIALEKAKYETKASIENIKLLCTKLTYGELAYCIYYLHVMRVIKNTELESLTNMSADRFSDVLKHSISCIFKYSDISRIQKNAILCSTCTKIQNAYK